MALPPTPTPSDHRNLQCANCTEAIITEPMAYESPLLGPHSPAPICAPCKPAVDLFDKTHDPEHLHKGGPLRGLIESQAMAQLAHETLAAVAWCQHHNATVTFPGELVRVKVTMAGVPPVSHAMKGATLPDAVRGLAEILQRHEAPAEEVN